MGGKNPLNTSNNVHIFFLLEKQRKKGQTDKLNQSATTTTAAAKSRNKNKQTNIQKTRQGKKIPSSGFSLRRYPLRGYAFY